jgi:hypothetical protein
MSHPQTCTHIYLHKNIIRWLLGQKEARKKFLQDEHKFSYLSYLERQFYPAYRAGHIVGGEDKNLVLQVCFSGAPPPFAQAICDGYLVHHTILQKKKKKRRQKKKDKHYFMAGTSYLVEGFPLHCPIPHVIVFAGTDPGTAGMAKSKWMQPEYHTHPVLKVQSEVQVSAQVARIAEIDRNVTPKRRFLVCMLGMQPGAGKSSYSGHLCKVRMPLHGDRFTYRAEVQ